MIYQKRPAECNLIIALPLHIAVNRISIYVIIVMIPVCQYAHELFLVYGKNRANDSIGLYDFTIELTLVYRQKPGRFLQFNQEPGKGICI